MDQRPQKGMLAGQFPKLNNVLNQAGRDGMLFVFWRAVSKLSSKHVLSLQFVHATLLIIAVYGELNLRFPCQFSRQRNNGYGMSTKL